MIYSDEQLTYIEEKVQNKTIKEVTRLFNKKYGTNLTYKAISSTMKRKGIKTGRDGKFQKGSVPANKGKKGVCYEGCKATQFKPGQRPQTWVPIGTEVWREDGYLWIKMWDNNLPARKNWIQKHRLIWEEANGEVPKGYQVMFADQDKKNICLDNLILVTAAEKAVMSKNRLFYKDAESTKVGLSIAK
ncbi:MAG: HNH endonuclease signature motif containing protein, partial [Carnobacterium sp.]